MSSGLLLVPFVIATVLLKRTSVYIAVISAARAELLLAVSTAIIGYPEYSKDFLEALFVGLPVGLLIAWVATREKSNARAVDYSGDLSLNTNREA